MPPYGQSPKSTKVVLPVTMAVLGASLMVMAVMLLTKEKGKTKDNGTYEIENYDVVGDIPFIYSICE